MHDRVYACPAGEELNEECLRLDRVIRVVGFHAFVVFRKDGVGDCKFSEHWVSHSFEDSINPRFSLSPMRSSPHRMHRLCS